MAIISKAEIITTSNKVKDYPVF